MCFFVCNQLQIRSINKALTDLHEQARTAQGALSTEIQQNILKFEEKKKVITAASSCGLNVSTVY